VAQKLGHCYGRPPRRRSRPLLDVLVETILSQNTSDLNSGRAFASLKRAYPTWESALAAGAAHLADEIRSGGLAAIKSRRIIALLRLLPKQRGAPTLEHLREMPAEEAYRSLLAIKGVGPKTAACTLLFGAGIPVFPVDTHIFRVSQRLGWTRAKETAERYQDRIRSMIPDQMVYPLHLSMIEHGRQACHPRRPACAGCCIRAHCPWRENDE
jgi:endonuclease-3